MTTGYNNGFFHTLHQEAIDSAKTILPIAMESIPPVSSTVDVGCGGGTWLSVMKQLGVEDIQGYDGAWVTPEQLQIPIECFQELDLDSAPLVAVRRYDLAICLEVAEHLQESRADFLIDFLISLSDFVLFSAAVPHQGGTHHVNEQWQHYWVEKFTSRGYIPKDLIRPRIWNNSEIPFWFRQNILLFVKQKHQGDVRNNEQEYSLPLDVVHPELYTRNVELGVQGSFHLLVDSLRKYIRKRI